MSRYLGFVTIMVNVASEWGLTEREYTQLQELYNKYQKDGLRIVAFPSNEFGNQEPGDNSVIEDFVTQKFGVTFDMMAKTTVNGDHPEPVIAWAKNHPNGSGFLFNTIKWVRVINNNFRVTSMLRPNVLVKRFGCWWRDLPATSRVRHQHQVSVTNITFWRIMMSVTDVSPSGSV